MKTFLFSLIVCIISIFLYTTVIAQNTFPSTGNVGIGTTSPIYELQVDGDIYASSGWLRVAGARGLYFENYGGGFYMRDNAWIRTYGSKNFYHNAGIMRTDGALHVGPTGDRFLVTQSGNVGIGTTSPTYKLQVAGGIYASSGWVRVGGDRGIYFQSHGGGFYMRDNTWIRVYGGKNFYQGTGIMRTDGVFQVGANGTRLLVTQSGNVGIGTINPTYKLQVAGDIYTNSGWVRVGQDRGIYFENYGGGFHMKDNSWIRTFGNKSFYHNTGIMRTDGIFQVGPYGNRFLVDQSGSVGVGTTTIPAGYKMAINGKVIATEVRIKPYNIWPDYVFASDYELKPLKEVAAYIQAEKHLPGVPSAEEIAQDGGFEIGQMTQTLLEKVEELTLYMIDLKEENEVLMKNIIDLKEENQMMKVKMKELECN